jgi:hypothetical protein
VNFNGTANSNLTGTYSQTGTTVTVTATAHGFITGNSAFLDFTSGTAVDGAYEVTVTGVNTFTVTQASRTTSGNVTVRQNTIRASGNVSSIADTGVGNYIVNFATAMPDADYAVVTCGVGSAGFVGLLGLTGDATKSTTAVGEFINRSVGASSTSVVDANNLSIAVFR